MSAIPSAWMPAAKMQRIIVHWTAGRHKASALDKKHYHILIEGDGTVIKGDPSIKLNEAPAKKGYAAHTLNCNSGSIGVSTCGMWNAKESPFDPGPAPLTAVQWTKMMGVVAELCVRYGIPVTPKTVLTHAEVQANLGIKQRGKWDVTRVPFAPGLVGAKACGDSMRKHVAAFVSWEPAPSHTPLEHIVAKKDTWYGVARQYGIGLDRLLAWNDAHASDTLAVGRKLRLTGKVLPEPAPAPPAPAPDACVAPAMPKAATLAGPNVIGAFYDEFVERVFDPLPHPEPKKETAMLNTTILPVIRHMLQLGAGFLIAQGQLDTANAETLIGAVIGLVSVGWWYFTKKA